MIPLLDLHSDTLLELYKNKFSIETSSLHISYENARPFSPYIQIGAVWSESSLSNNDSFLQYKSVVSYAKNQGIYFARSVSDIRDRCFILAIEDARLLDLDASRLDILYSDGVRILGLNWSGETVIGGAWDTNSSLSPFGKEAVAYATSMGMICDISHSNERASYEAIAIASKNGGTVIATHSNSYSICPHKRNISDKLFSELKGLGSLVGISLACEHLTNTKTAEIDDIIRHVDHFLCLGGEKTVALGCDFDGVSSLPRQISTIKNLDLLYCKLAEKYGEGTAKNIFFYNAYNFLSRSLK